DHLGVYQRVVIADRLDVELPKLTVAASLGTVVAKGGDERVELDRLWSAGHSMLEVRSDDGGRAFGPQRQLGAALVLKPVNLLVHDVGAFADAAQEQPGLLEGGGADLAVAVATGGCFGAPLDVSPDDGVLRQNVLRAARRLIHGDLLECERPAPG